MLVLARRWCRRAGKRIGITLFYDAGVLYSTSAEGRPRLVKKSKAHKAEIHVSRPTITATRKLTTRVEVQMG
jgi:hypothetical protein